MIVNCNYLDCNGHRELKENFKVQGLNEVTKAATRTIEHHETLTDEVLPNHREKS